MLSHARRVPGWLVLLPVGFGVLAVLLGKDNNVDLMHYYYLPFAWMSGRFGHDLLPTGIVTFFNPLLDVPFYWANQHLPAITITFLLGALHGVNGILIWLIARHTLRLEPAGFEPLSHSRLGTRIAGVIGRPGAAATLVMLIGMLSLGSIYVVGTTYYDALVGMPVFLALLLIARAGPAIFDGPLGRAIPVMLCAGMAVGAAVGLKQTVVPFAVGIGLALLLTPGPYRQRLANAASYGVGLGIGVIAVSGFWLWHLWQLTGNPLFPYFNDLFHSPLAPVASNRTRYAMPRNALEAVTYPFVFTWAPWRITSPARDLKLLVAYLVVPVGIACALFGRRRGTGNRLAEPRFGLFLLIAMAATYVVWLWLFSIYRYVVPLEMLVPLLVVVAVGFMPLTTGRRLLALAVLLLLVVPIQPSNSDRLPWGNLAWQPFVQVRPPDGFDFSAAMVVAPSWYPGWQPYAFVIPFFPPDMSFIYIVGREVPDVALVSRFLPEIADRIARHTGPLYVLYTPPGEADVAASLARHGLVADFAGCRPVVANIGRPFALCPVSRGAGAMQAPR
jgi:hypothetical protein